MTLLFDAAGWMQTADGAYLMIRTNRRDATAFCEKMKEGKVYEAELKEHRKKRSLDANAYLWLLCSKLADKLSDGGTLCTKEDVYRDAVKARGIYREQGGLPIDFAKTSRTAWEMLGTGWVTEQVDFEPDGDRVIVRYYYGTSTYNTKQMSRVIDWIVDECKQQGIETMTPAELALLMDGWNKQ